VQPASRMDISNANQSAFPAEGCKIPLVFVVGPTAVGKSRVGVELAKRLGGEVVSADSMQIYRGMDIGTAKLTYDEMQSIPHHCINIVDPAHSFSVVEYRQAAEDAIEQIWKRGHYPIIVGGTGLYVQSLTHTMTYTEAGEDEAFRERMYRIAQEPDGNLRLHQQLQKVDPQTAMRLHPNDLRRVIRALEVFAMTGKPMSQQYGTRVKNPKYHTVLFGLNRERSELYRAIDQRVDEMIEKGLVEEVKHLLEMGVDPDCTAMQAIGYKEIVAYFQGDCSLDEAIDRIKQGSRRYAKRQLSWFRRISDIVWYNVEEHDFAYIIQQMMEVLKKEFGIDFANSSETI
jgi:tRNA dimethylallyltransferase